MNEYFNKIAEMIADKTGVDLQDVTEEAYFEDDLNIGEIELLDIISALEEEYAVEFEEEEKERIKSVMDMVEIIVEKVD